MLSYLLALPLALAAPAAHSGRAAGAIAGTGIINVLVDTSSDINLSTATPALTVGCLNAAGKVVLNDCASFTGAAYSASTTEGDCSFKNPVAPVNSDAVYGSTVHALTCSDATTSASVSFYTVVSFWRGIT